MNNFISLALFSLFVIHAASGYDFDDPDYNRILANDLEEFSDQSENPQRHRMKRDENSVENEKCHRRKFRACCAEKTFAAIHEYDKEVKRECFMQVFAKEKRDRKFWTDPFNCEDVETRRKNMICAMQCYFEKRNITNSEGKIQEETFKRLLQYGFKNETWLIPKLDDIADKCIAEARKFSMAEKKKNSNGCNSEALILGYCIYREIQLSCPAIEITDMKACERMKFKLLGNESNV